MSLFIIINIINLLISVYSLNCSNNINYYNNSCPNELITPDCNYINSNLYTICNSITNSTKIINGNNCSVDKSDIGCSFNDLINNSSNKVFCCESNFLSSSISPTFSSLPTATCAFRLFNSQTDFSNIQGRNGWYYGYYNGNVFTQFTNYAISSTGSVGSFVSWNYNQVSNGIISSTMIMQNGAISCNTPTYGNIAPVLRWYNPIGSCYQDITIWLFLSGSSNSAGSIVTLTVNGVTIYYLNGVPNVNSYFNSYGVRSIELSVGPSNSNCDYGQTTYTLNISPIGPSNTAKTSTTNSISPNISSSSKRSISNSYTTINTNSIIKSISSTSSASATATVFYTGNWTDLGQLNYANSDIQPAPLGSMTIRNCQINCWLNPLCGLIVVTSPCNTISLNSNQVNTVVCEQCWLKLTSGWAISSDSVSRSIMLYDRVYPPTTTSVVSKTTTASIEPSDSLVNSRSSSRSTLISFSSQKSNTISSSSSQSKTSSASIESTDSLRNSKTNTATASSSSTVFYSGNWTDYGRVYFTNYVQVLGSLTINQCMISCWLDPLCGGISVNYGCSDINLDSPQIFTLLCTNCRTIPRASEMDTRPGIFNQHSEWKSFIIYDKIFPPTTSVISSKTSTVSAIPTSTLVMYSSYNMCNNNGQIINLPFPDSYTILRTNEPGTSYANSINCAMTISGGNTKQVFQINFTSFNTEGCCDPFKIFDSSDTQVFSTAGTVIPSLFYITSNSIRLQMISDGSVTFSGVVVKVSLYLLSNTPSPTITNSARITRTLTGSISNTPIESFSKTISSSISNSKSPLVSNSNTAIKSFSKTISSSISNSRSSLISNSNTPIKSFSKSESESFSSRYSNTKSSIVTNILTSSSLPTYSPTISLIKTVTSTTSNINSLTIFSSNSILNTITNILTISPINSPSNSGSISISISVSKTVSNSNYKSNSPLNTFSIIQSQTPSFSKSISQTLSVSSTYSSTISPSQYIKLSDDQIGSKLLDSFIGNKSSLSANETTAIFNSVSNLPAAQITNLLRTAGVLTLVSNPDVPFEISTDTFSFIAQIIPPKPINVTTTNLKLNIPNLNISGSAVSIITWNDNPYNVGQKLDTNVLSVSISKLTGQEVSIYNLSEPLQFKYKLNLDPNDSRIDIATYKINCFDNLNYKITANGPSFVNLVKNNSNYIIPCSNKNYSIGCSLNDTLVTFTCPKPDLIAKCMYWNSSLGIWDDKGCSVISITNNELICNCSHLTDFGSRFEAVYKSNKDIFADASSVYSLDGLQKYKQFYITFGVIAIIGFIAFGIGLYLDIISAKKYFNSLIEVPMIKDLKQRTGCLIDICYDYPIEDNKKTKGVLVNKNGKMDKKEKIEKKEKKSVKFDDLVKKDNNYYKRFILIWWNRLLFQHSHFSAFLRFDPRMPRLFRLLVIFVAQFNSLFLTAFLYAFKYGDESVGADVEAIALIDIIVLAILTALLNTPFINLLIRFSNFAGIEEFKWRYPILYDELIKRHDFENELVLFSNEELEFNNLNIVKYKNKINSDIKKDKKSINNLYNNDNNEINTGDYEESGIINSIISFFKNKKKDVLKDKGTIDNAYQIANKSFPITIKKPYYYSYFPFHTKIGGFIFFISIGWFIWCLNYLLLFAAHHDSSVSTNMITSFGISEITTVFITQPLTLFFVMLITYTLNIFLKKFNFKKNNIKIPNIYYFSDPFIKPYSTLLSSSFAYHIFLNSPANLIDSSIHHNKISKNLGYAPLNGIMESIESNETDSITIDSRHEKIIELYEVLKDKEKLNNLSNVIYINDLDDYKYYSNNSIIIKEVETEENITDKLLIKRVNKNLELYKSIRNS